MKYVKCIGYNMISVGKKKHILISKNKNKKTPPKSGL